jgi:putative NADH-flavin reductase
MNIVIIGASGTVGSALRDEALARGHRVTAIVRHPEKIVVKSDSLNTVKGDVLKDKVDDLVRGYDAVISAYNPGWTNPNIADETLKAYRAIIDGVKKADVKRLLVVGGAGSLEVSPGVQLIDTMQVPDLIRSAILALRDVLYTLREEKKLDWTFLSPAANFVPGGRTGHFRLGKDQVIKDQKGESKISVQDYAVAMIDELEKPKHSRQRFTLGY